MLLVRDSCAVWWISSDLALDFSQNPCHLYALTWCLRLIPGPYWHMYHSRLHNTFIQAGLSSSKCLPLMWAHSTAAGGATLCGGKMLRQASSPQQPGLPGPSSWRENERLTHLPTARVWNLQIKLWRQRLNKPFYPHCVSLTLQVQQMVKIRMTTCVSRCAKKRFKIM